MSVSPSDPNPKGIMFYTLEAATKHKSEMDAMIDSYNDPSSGVWNKDYWKELPQKWKIFR